ncbi:MAG: glycosyltransferase family 2 protein [Clostridia bacterium]|nr:glycosyltransferase family 2 protein [Clostridia bacterium]
MKEELHLFIIWENARNMQDEIIEDIRNNFTIVNIYEIEWDKSKFSNNLTRFYGTNLPKGSHKEKHCGNGGFILILVKDGNPVYAKRETSKGEKIVNTNIFDKKEQYRTLTGGGHKIHATNNTSETNHDITLLLGMNTDEFLDKNKQKIWDGSIKKISSNLIGCDGWKSVQEMFYVLNNCVNYAILRNYESLPDEIYNNNHNDIDIICDSKEETAYILNAAPVFMEDYRVHYRTTVNNQSANFDLRHVGDNYYCSKMERDILNRRIYNSKGFYTLNNEDHFYTLVYHALIQKLDFAKDYKDKLIKMNIENINEDSTLDEYASILKKWMLRNDYIVVRPEDKSVIFNEIMLDYFIPFFYCNEKTIDIVMATYNGEKYIRKQLDSILNQTYTNFRLLISDDASTDDTVNIIQEYQEKDMRIKLFIQPSNVGVKKNFEFLLRKVESNLYALADQDDIWLPEKLEKCVIKMQEDNSDLVFSDLKLINEDDNIISGSFWNTKKFDKKIKKDKRYNGLLLNNYITGCTILSKKTFLNNILPIPDESKYMLHDYWIAVVVSQNGIISKIEEPLVMYRQHAENQVGCKTVSKNFNSMKDIRSLFIDVKIQQYTVYTKNDQIFNNETNKINMNALKYFQSLKNKKRFNFKNWGLFYNLYKYENVKYFIANFIILNVPIIARLIYKRR